MEKYCLNFIKILEGLKSDDIDDFLDNKVKEKYISSCNGEKFQGWHHDITIDSKGILYISGQLSNGTMSMDLYEGRELFLASIPTYVENAYDITSDDIRELDKEKLYKIVEEAEKKLYFEDEYEELEKDNIYDKLNYFMENQFCEILDIFKDLYEEEYKELRRDCNEADWNSYYDILKETIYENINENLIRFREQLEL